MTTAEQLITDSADLHDLTLEPLTTAGMAEMSALLDRIERSARMAMSATAPA